MSIINKLQALSKKSLQLAQHKVPGGIQPPAFKTSSLRSRIMGTPLPDCLILSLQQGQGLPAQALVKPGDKVLKYQIIAQASGTNSVSVHAPTSGTIREIAASTMAIPSNEQDQDQKQICIYLEPDGKDQAMELNPAQDISALSQTQLIEKVSAAGISGMGGAGFPTEEKVRLASSRQIDLLIINAAECEPYITADEALIRERADDVVKGAEILQRVCSAKRCIIAIEDKKTDALQQLLAAVKNSGAELITVSTKYPIGGEKQLIQAVSGKQVPSGEYPAQLGILLFNAGTAYATYKAVAHGEPCISRIITLTGEALRTPKNFEALIGTPTSFLFELCGVDETTHFKTILGGSMMGIECSNTDFPISKTSNCLIAGSYNEFPDAPAEQACIRCGFCAQACPINLLPQQLLAYGRSQNPEQLIDHGLSDCIECGACDYVCPSHIALVQQFRDSKVSIREREAQREQSQLWQERFQFHQYRMKRTLDETLDKKPAKNQSTINKSSIEAQTVNDFSRDKAKQDIADAVARVQARKSKIISSSKVTDSIALSSNKPGSQEPEKK